MSAYEVPAACGNCGASNSGFQKLNRGGTPFDKEEPRLRLFNCDSCAAVVQADGKPVRWGAD